MLTCQQATQLLSEKQDRQLVLKEQSSLQFILMLCPCRRFGQQMKTLSQLSKGFRKYDN